MLKHMAADEEIGLEAGEAGLGMEERAMELDAGVFGVDGAVGIEAEVFSFGTGSGQSFKEGAFAVADFDDGRVGRQPVQHVCT